MRNNWLLIVALLLGLLAGWFATSRWYKSLPKEVETVEVIKYKYKDVAPKPIDIKPIDVKVPTVLIVESVRDSIQEVLKEVMVKDTLTLKGEQKHYADSTYDLWVSGVSVQLDSINTYNKTTTIYKTASKKGVDLGPFVASQFSPNLIQVSTGLSLEIPIKRWDITLSGGYQATSIRDQPINVGPFGMVTATFNIF